MDQGFMATVRKLAVPFMIATFIIGIGLGLLLAWQVWPIRWYDTDASDLRIAHQKEYVVMVANSLLVTGDANAARKQLYELTDDDTSWAQVVDFVEQVAVEKEQTDDGASAQRIRRMAQALDLPATTPEPFQAPKRSILNPPKWAVLLLATAVFIVGLACLAWIVFRMVKRRSQGKASVVEEQVFEETPAEAIPEPEAGPPSWEVEEVQEVAAAPPWRAPALEPTSLQEAAVPIVDETPFSSGLTPTIISTLEEPEEEFTLEEARPQAEPEVTPEEETLPQAELEVGPEEEETPPQAEPEIVPEAVPDHMEPSPPPSADLGPLAVFETRYQFGDDDFDANFSIEPEGEFVGECGMGISDVLEADEAQHVDAFELWLFDKGDIRTVSKVLASGYAYQDESLNAKLSAKGELVMAEPGLVIELETLSLKAKVTIKDVQYLPDEETPDCIFSDLAIEMVVERVKENA